MESTIKINLDMSGFKRVEKTCEALSHTVEVGILHNPEEARIGALQHDGGIGYYQYGEFEGQAVDIPPRPFLMRAIDHYGKEILEQNTYIMKDFTPENAEKALERVGDMAKAVVQAEIDDYARAGGNSPRTIETKGKDSPLIDKGNLRSSIEYEVIK
jgi:hypothetical protein